ncbi:MAG: hypothetical protein MPEBLZ_03630 [Candidatus Methanoperedens nitroreducens]|uniref:Uncharacterized protein n=1 Tax=Candidatus Methanoperedens nitratireducens TaxID=1392998 RepID=A0A0P7ZB78_9EURY|nr:MAG: hypothetical protein MPEBLZ_03630 [Candidatus Methanoperedens sp. BLZ1]
MAHMAKVEVVMDEKALLARRMLNFKLVKLSWALFFILIGGSWILESLKKIDGTQKWGVIYAGCGAILLLLNLMRIAWKINISKFTTWLGTLLLLYGIATFYEFKFSILAAAILVIGLIMLLEVFRK